MVTPNVDSIAILFDPVLKRRDNDGDTFPEPFPVSDSSTAVAPGGRAPMRANQSTAAPAGGMKPSSA